MSNLAPPAPVEAQGLCAVAQRVREESVARWGVERAVTIVGLSPALVGLLERLARIAGFEESVLVLGESGVGKEALAQALYLLGRRAGGPYVSVNCPQYQEGNLTVSELFGHRRGSFTGAVADRKGCFETANGGVIFLDEIGDLPMNAQLMLLRALASGEFQPLGSEVSRRSDVRVVAATNRSLNELAAERAFRRDLLFRLRYFLFQVPPLRERGEDWRLLLDHVLGRLHDRYGVAKRFSADSLRLLESYPWPGNVRELISVATSGYALSEGDIIEPRSFADSLDGGGEAGGNDLDILLGRLMKGDADFWALVQRPFLERDLNRPEVQRLVARGLRQVEGSYRDLLRAWGMPDGDYQKFMDFLRHNRLKPSPPAGRPA
jgi:DNA-binding NtrC family response regulator